MGETAWIRFIASTHFFWISFRDQIKNAFWVQFPIPPPPIFFFLNSSKQKDGNLKHILDNRCLFLPAFCQLFSGWAVRKVGYRQDTKEQSRSDFLLFGSLLFEIMAWIWAWVQSKHLVLLRSRHFSKEASYFPATPRRIKIYIIVNFLLTDSLSRLWGQGASLCDPATGAHSLVWKETNTVN